MVSTRLVFWHATQFQQNEDIPEMYISQQWEQNHFVVLPENPFFIIPIVSMDSLYQFFQSWFSCSVSFFFAGKPFDELRQQIVPIWTEKPGSNVRQHLD